VEILAVTIPIFLFVAAGYAGRKKGLIGEETKNFLSKTVYYFAMPALIIRSILSFDFDDTFRLDLVAHNLIVTSIICLITFFAAYFLKDARKRGSFNMSCFRSNQGYIGLPVINGFYGASAMSKTAVINGFDSPLVILLSALTLGIYRKDPEKTRRTVLRKFISFFTNPLVMAAFASLLLSYLKVPLLNIPVADDFLEIAGYMSLPLALISIGASIRISRIRADLVPVLAAAVIKLLAMPLLAYILARFMFHFTGENLGLSVILTATPTSVSSYIMAAEMDADEEFMAASIGFTTFASVLTISLIKLLLN
jgi:predicted permease